MSTLIEQLGWVLVHTLWQFAPLSAIAFVLQRAMQRASSSARYLVLLGMLAAVVAAPLVTWSILPVEAPPPVIAAAPVPVPMQIPPALPHEVMLAPTPVASPPAPLTAASVVPVVEAPPIASAPLPELPQPTWSERVQGAVTPWLSTIVWGWSLGVLAFALRPLLSWFTVRRFRTTGVSPVPEAVQAALTATAQRLGITQAVRVLQSAVVQVPIVAGYFQPVILLPVSIVTGMPASQLEAILAHELAHIRRHDYLFNLVQTLVETVFFYHPAVWWLSHQIRCERENCCDDIAVTALGSRLEYSRALLALEELRSVQSPLALGANGGSLLSRVRRLFHREPDSSSLSSGSVALGVVLVVGVFAIAAIAGGQLTADPADEEVSFAGPVADQTSWPQLGGSAGHNPVSTVTNLPTQFDLAKKENIRWSQPIGKFAFSSPVVSGGKVLIGTNNAIGRDQRFPKTNDVTCLQCFDEAKGAFLWQYSSLRMEVEKDWPLLRICLVPVVEGDRVWLVTNRCEVVCLDLNGHRDHEDDGLPEPEASAPGAESADVVWKYDLFSTLGVRPQKAACVTPTIAGNLLLLNSPNDVDESGQKPATPGAPAFLAFDKTSGQLVWSDKTPNTNIHCDGCSMGAPVAPAAALIDGTWQAIFAGYDGWLYAYDLEAIQRGETQTLWKFDLNPKTARLWYDRGIANTPVVVGDRVYAAVGHNADRGSEPGRLWCIDATKRGDLSSDLVYNKSAPDVVIPHKQLAVEPDKGDFTRPNPHSGVVWVYTSDDLNQNGKIEINEQMHLSNSLPAIHDGLLLTTDLNGYVHCLDAATGKRLWSHDLSVASSCGPLIANGKAWLIDDDGDLSIFALSREKQLLAEHPLNSPGYTNLAAANETLYVATKTQLIAIGSGEFPQPGRISAKLPGGLEIELFGITPNAAPTSEGWRGDGQPIVNAGDWPRGATFSKDGDRYTVATGTATKLTPDPVARDLLFECRGAASRPSWTVLRQSGLTEFQTLGTDAGLRKRLTMLRKDQAVQTTVEMAYTDSPWGPWQRIDAAGMPINTIETFASDQKLYGEMKIVRLGASANKSDQGSPLELVLSEPAVSDDYYSGIFAIDVRFVDRNQKVWATYPRPEPLKDGRRTVTWTTGGPVALENLQYAEFRLRPYRHFITFENVPLEKTAAGRVSVKHRSLAEPPPRTPDPRFVAHVPGGVDIELLRIVRNDQPDDQSWTPNGSAPSHQIDWPRRSAVHPSPNGGHSSGDDGAGSDRAWDISYDVRGSGVRPIVSVDVVDGGASSSQSVPAIGPQLITLIPNKPEALTKLQLRVGTEPWGEWIQVGADGEILNPEALSDRPDSPEKLITLAGAGLDEDDLDRCWIKWLALPNAQQLYSMEVRAIDDDGDIHQARNQNYKITTRPLLELTHWFNLPVEKLARFEYRLRPYRHLVTFDHICTDPAKPTEVRVSVDPIVYLEVFPSPEAAVNPTRPLVAKLPGGLEVELVGVTKNFAPTKEGWKPSGSPIGEIDEWKPRVIPNSKGVHTSLTDDGTIDPAARDLLVEMRGLQSQPAIALLDIQANMGWGQRPHADPYRNRLSLLLNKPSDTLTFRMAMSDAPWGPYQQVGLDGKLLNELDLASPEAELYGLIRVIRCGPHPDNPEQSELTLKMPEKHRELYSFSIHAIDTEGKEMLDFPVIENDSSGKVTAKYRTDSGFSGKVARWEYRLRPYRHFITFENVSFEPGKKTEPKVSVESIAEPESTSKAPPAANPILQMLESARTHYNGGDVVQAHVGYTPPLHEGWMNWLDKAGTTSLEKLPAGKHWLIARHPWTVFPVELPLASSPLKQQPRAGLPPRKHNSNQYSGELVVEIDKAGKEFIRVNVSNMTDEPWSFCELDLTLGVGWGGEESEAHSPLWLTEKLQEAPRVEVAARQTGTFRVDWADWVRRGIWDPMSGVQEQDRPTLPEQQPGKVWVRIGGPGFGTLPVAVTHPDKLLVNAGSSKTTATLPGGLELELLGVTPFRGSGQDGWTPQGLKFEKAPEWASGLKLEPLPPGEMGDSAHDDYRDFIVRVRGFSPEQLALLPFSQKFEVGDSTIGRMQVLTYNQQVQRLRIGIPGEWGPYRVLTVDPNVVPKAPVVKMLAKVHEPFRKIYDSVQLRLEASDAREERWGRPLMKSFPPDYRPGDADPDFEPGSRVRVVWKGLPTNPDLKYATHEAFVIDLERKSHKAIAKTTFIEPEGGQHWEVDIFNVPISQVSHVEYHLRPYQHVVTFNNVALHPGAKCGPNVVVESPLDDAGNAKAPPAPAVGAEGQPAPSPAPSLPKQQPQPFTIEPVNGRVLLPNGQPAVGVPVVLRRTQWGRHQLASTVEMGTDDPHDLARTVTDAQGGFAFRDVPVPDSYRNQVEVHVDVVARQDGHSLAWSRVIVGTPVTLTLQPEATLTGRVTGPSGEPVAGAVIQAAWVMSLRHITQADLEEGRWPSWKDRSFVGLTDCQLVPTATTNENGEFTLSGLPRGLGMRLFVRSAEFEPQWFDAATVPIEGENLRLTKRPVASGPLKIGMQTPRELLAIRVVDDATGAPLEGAKVIARPSGRLPVSQTGNESVFRLAAGDVSISAELPLERGYLRGWGVFDASQAHSGEIRLTRGIPLRGHVIDQETNLPLAEIDVRVDGRLDEVRIGNACLWSKTGSDGAFNLLLAPGKHVVWVRPFKTIYRDVAVSMLDGQFGVMAHQSATIDTNQLPDTLELALERAEGIEGVVLDPQGELAAGVHFRGLYKTDYGAQGIGDVTTEQGEFIISQLFAKDPIARAVPLDVLFWDEQRGLVGSLRVDPVIPSVAHEVQLTPMGRLTGRVVDDQGKPVAHALVQCGIELPNFTRQTVAVCARPVRTGADGRFEILSGVAGYTFDIDVERPGYVKEWKEFSLAANERDKELGDIVLEIEQPVRKLTVELPPLKGLTPEAQYTALSLSFDTLVQRVEATRKVARNYDVVPDNTSRLYAQAMWNVAQSPQAGETEWKALLWMVGMNRLTGNNGAEYEKLMQQAGSRLIEAYADRPEIAAVADTVAWTQYGLPEGPHRAALVFLEKSPDRSARGICCLLAAESLVDWGPAKSRPITPETISRVEPLLNRVVSEFADLPHADDWRKGTLGDCARGWLETLKQVQQGVAVLDMVWKDSQGQPLRLSDLKGKVVVLDVGTLGDDAYSRTLLDQAGPDRVVVIQVSHQNVEKAWKALDGLTIPRRQISHEEANRFERMWNIRTWPGAIVLNERGGVEGDDLREKLPQVLASVLESKATGVPEVNHHPEFP